MFLHISVLRPFSCCFNADITNFLKKLFESYNCINCCIICTATIWLFQSLAQFLSSYSSKCLDYLVTRVSHHLCCCKCCDVFRFQTWTKINLIYCISTTPLSLLFFIKSLTLSQALSTLSETFRTPTYCVGRTSCNYSVVIIIY